MGEYSQIIEDFRGKFQVSKRIKQRDILDFIQKFQDSLADEDARKKLDSQWIVEVISFVALAATRDKKNRRYWTEEDILPLTALLEVAQMTLGDLNFKKVIQVSALKVNQAQIIIRDPFVSDRTYINAYLLLDQWELNAKTHYLRILAQVGGDKYKKHRKELAIEVENGQKAVNNRAKVVEARLLSFGYIGFRTADILSRII